MPATRQSIVSSISTFPVIQHTKTRVLFALTPGVPLSVWANMGILDRELEPYLFHVQRGGEVTVLQSRIGQIPILPPEISTVTVPDWRFLRVFSRFGTRTANRIDVIKTNQTVRSHLFVELAERWHKPLVIRGGYVFGEYLERTEGITPSTHSYQQSEGRALRAATLVQVPTEILAQWVIDRYAVEPDRVRVVPNFVDTQRFSPRTQEAESQETVVVSVGRLVPVKQFDLLVAACSRAHVPQLRIAGEGIERERLRALARDAGLDLELVGQVHNDRLPDFLRRNIMFVITSQSEGHPKALIEAMACGLPCVGVDVRGVRNLIIHEYNGLLVAPEVPAIADAMERLMNDAELRRTLGQNARDYVVENFAKTKILEADAAVLEEAVKRGFGS